MASGFKYFSLSKLNRAQGTLGEFRVYRLIQYLYPERIRELGTKVAPTSDLKHCSTTTYQDDCALLF